MTSKQKRLDKKNAKRKERNKALRLQREKSAALKRQQGKEIRSVSEFTANYVRDALSIIQYREQFANSVRGMIKVIENAKAVDPAQFSSLPTEAFTTLLDKINGTDEQFKTLAETAAKIETTQGVNEKMMACMDGIGILSEAQMAIMDISGEFTLIESSMREMLSGKKPVPEEIDKPEETEFEDVEAKEVGRTHKDYEFEFPAELAVENEK